MRSMRSSGRRSSRPLGRGLSEYVLRMGTALRVDNAEIEELEQRGEIAPRAHGFASDVLAGRAVDRR